MRKCSYFRAIGGRFTQINAHFLLMNSKRCKDRKKNYVTLFPISMFQFCSVEMLLLQTAWFQRGHQFPIKMENPGRRWWWWWGGGGFPSEILLRDGGMDILVLEQHDKKINDFLVLLQNKCLQCPNPYC